MQVEHASGGKEEAQQPWHPLIEDGHPERDRVWGHFGRVILRLVSGGSWVCTDNGSPSLVLLPETPGREPWSARRCLGVWDGLAHGGDRRCLVGPVQAEPARQVSRWTAWRLVWTAGGGWKAGESLLERVTWSKTTGSEGKQEGGQEGGGRQKGAVGLRPELTGQFSAGTDGHRPVQCGLPDLTRAGLPLGPGKAGRLVPRGPRLWFLIKEKKYQRYFDVL